MLSEDYFAGSGRSSGSRRESKPMISGSLASAYTAAI